MKFNKKAQGFILKKTLIKETWAFFEIFTKEFWKKSFFVRNIKKSKLIKPAYLSLWNEVEFEFLLKSKTPIITEVKLLNSLDSSSLEFLQTLSYFLELISHLTPAEYPNEKIYFLKSSVFHLLKSWVDHEKIKFFFEIRILSILWFLSDLNKFVDTWKKIDLVWNIAFDQNIWWFISKYSEFDNLIFLDSNLVKVVNFYRIWDIGKIFSIDLNEEDFFKIKNLFKTIIKMHCPTNLKSLSC